jgi:hypothetical protein
MIYPEYIKHDRAERTIVISDIHGSLALFNAFSRK